MSINNYAVIEFTANVVLQQHIQIFAPNLSVEDLVSGLEDGTFQTEIGHDGVDSVTGKIIDTRNQTTVARVLKQAEPEDYVMGTVTDVTMDGDYVKRGGNDKDQMDWSGDSEED